MEPKRNASKSRCPLKVNEISKEADNTKASSSVRRLSCSKDRKKITADKAKDALSSPEHDATETSNQDIPEVLRKQSTNTNCSSGADNDCPCNTLEAVEQISKQISYSDRRNWISMERLNELRKKATDAVKSHRIFSIRGCFFTVRNALAVRGWVEKLDVHRKYGQMGMSQITYEDLAQTLPKRRPGESRRQYLIKCERNIMSRFLEHVPIDFLWTARKEKCDWIDQAKNPSMLINRFHRAPFTSKEGLCAQLRDFHWFFEDGVSEMFFPRCYNVWSPEELSEFTENFRLTACIGLLKYMVDKCRAASWEAVFAQTAKVPFSAIDFAVKRVTDFLGTCNHIDIDNDAETRIWEHDWDAFLTNHYLLTHEQCRIQSDPRICIETLIKNTESILGEVKMFWPQYNLDGCLNIWIVKPANKCRGRGIHLMNNVKKIMSMVNPPIATKSRYVVQKYLERPLIIHNTKFDIRQWFLVSSVQPLIIWMYKESYLRFSSQEYDLLNYHESIHLTNHAVQKKYRNGKRDERLPIENMWDCYTFQTYLRQIGRFDMWAERIYPGMQHAIIGAMLASQDNMDRRTNSFELFGADFMICEDFYPWLIEINSSPDLGATTSVTARMCPQCLEDTIKVIIDRKADVTADTGNFEMIYRQALPPVPAYMGLNLFLKGKQVLPKPTIAKKERIAGSVGSVTSTCYYRTTSMAQPHSQLIPMPTYRPNFEIDADRTYAIKKPIFISDLLDCLIPAEAKRALTDGNLKPYGNKSPLNATLLSNGALSRSATSPTIRTDLLMSTATGNSHPTIQSTLSALNATLLEKRHNMTTEELHATQLYPYIKKYLSCGKNQANRETSLDVTKPPVREDFVGAKKMLLEKSVPAQESLETVSVRKDLLLAKQGYIARDRKTKSAKAVLGSRNLVPRTKQRCPASYFTGSLKKATSVGKLCTTTNTYVAIKQPKTLPTKITMEQYTSSPFYAVGMSLRAWKSRQHKNKKSPSIQHPKVRRTLALSCEKKDPMLRNTKISI